MEVDKPTERYRDGRPGACPSSEEGVVCATKNICKFGWLWGMPKLLKEKLFQDQAKSLLELLAC